MVYFERINDDDDDDDDKQNWLQFQAKIASK